MGFNYFGYGCVQPCGVINGKVYQVLPSGVRVEYHTKLDVTIPEQVNLYYGKTIAFLLQYDGKEYIGRFDGSISIIRQSDGLLVGLNAWEAPKRPEVIACGMYAEKGIPQVCYLDNRDRQSLYIQDQPVSSKLVAPYTGSFNRLDSTLSFLIDNTGIGHIYTKGGDALATAVWNIQKSVRGRNCRIFF